MAEPAKLLKVDEVAERLALSSRQVWNFVRDGRLPVVRMGRSTRVAESDLVAFVDAAKHAHACTTPSPEAA